MKTYILTLAMAIPAIASHAQNENGIRQLMEQLEKNHPEGTYYHATRNREGIYESWNWVKTYDTTRDKPADRYQLQQLKDTVMQRFLEASANAVACHQQQTPNGTEDHIRYALVLAEDADTKAELYRNQEFGSYDDFHYNGGKETAEFSYHPERSGTRLAVGYNNDTRQKSSGKPLDLKPLKGMIAEISAANNGHEHLASYRYNTQQDELSRFFTHTYTTVDSVGNYDPRGFEGGDRMYVQEGGCSGTLYIIPPRTCRRSRHAVAPETVQLLARQPRQTFFL